MKEIVIMAGTTYPEKRLLSVLKTLFPECDVRIVSAGSERKEDRIRLQASDKEIGASFYTRTLKC